VVGSVQVTFVASGWAVGLAHEAALKGREAAQLWTESYPAMELRHGPISVLTGESVAWVFGAPPDGLIEELEATEALVLCSGADPMVELVLAQRLAVAVAESRRLDPDAPRNLTRSIVLPDAS
jgi:fructoselysine-6-P-deglycase FrlB-like protein